MCFDLTVPHPILCPEEDFEAFRHLARHVPTLEVSVFVGQNGPTIFTRQPSRESSMNPVRQILRYCWCGRINIPQNTSKKRSKKRRPLPPISTVSYEAAIHDVTSRKEQTSDAPDPTSTLDANGVPKTKRKRKGMSPSSELAIASLVQPPTSVPEGHERSCIWCSPFSHTNFNLIPQSFQVPGEEDSEASTSGDIARCSFSPRRRIAPSGSTWSNSGFKAEATRHTRISRSRRKGCPRRSLLVYTITTIVPFVPCKEEA